jgi:PKD repeat protein
MRVANILVVIAVAGALIAGAAAAQEADGPEIPPPREEPNDIDGDGLYEDVNGDETFSIADVQTLFSNIDSDYVNEHPDKFDFAGRDDGEVTIADVQKLFLELVDDE